ncbi:MAG: hypothetical protein U0132_16630 [Gemmatimonadaceae bacterium]
MAHVFTRRYRPMALVAAAIPFLLTPMAIEGQMQGVDAQRIATLLVERMALTRGERVFLLVAPGEADSLITPLRAAIRGAGAVDLGALSTKGPEPAAWATDWTRASHGLTGPALEAHVRTADLGIMLPGATPADSAYAAMQAVLRSGKGRTVHFHWAGAYGLDGLLQPMTPSRSQFYENVLRHTDYGALMAAQGRLESAMRGHPIRVTTPGGTDLTFQIGERPITRQDGEASLARAKRARNLIDREVELPAGAIRVAPIENSVNGTVAFPAGEWGGERVDGLVMTFVKGRLTRFTTRTGRAGVERELVSGGDAARAFREFALGMNPLLAIPESGERWIPYYGYGAGVVRLSLGDNTELGGLVGGGYVRWNFFTDATVTVGADVWVRGGRLVR